MAAILDLCKLGGKNTTCVLILNVLYDHQLLSCQKEHLYSKMQVTLAYQAY